ncbi:MAG: AhpC/TSA family protein [Rickettsiales bacterium]|nr:AhpC/TSA family protein [Rickettsiales bacterium]
MLRKIIAAAFVATVLFTIGALFWWTEVQYLLPTPIPEGYQEVYIEQKVYPGNSTQEQLSKPVFYHFFTTNCPCSRFNLTHFNSLRRSYGDSLDFVVVIPAEDDISKARPYFEGETKIIRDVNQEFAIALGVYSTPQAVIIDTDHQLYFRGNYNKARYCTDPLSNFAQMAIDSLGTGASPPKFGPLATIAYGCGIDYTLSM